MGWCGLDWSGFGYGHVEISCECGNEALGSIKCWKPSSGLSSSAQLHTVAVLELNRSALHENVF
jgi:hypothetical protein